MTSAVKPEERLAGSVLKAEHERRMEVVSDAAIACAKAVEAARLDEREQCAKLAETWRSSPRGTGTVDQRLHEGVAARGIASAIRKAKSR